MSCNPTTLPLLPLPGLTTNSISPISDTKASNPSVPAGHKGFERVNLPVPNSPSQWVVEAFITHPDHGLFILPEQEFDATPPLFMTLETPVVCRRGEQVSLW